MVRQRVESADWRFKPYHALAHILHAGCSTCNGRAQSGPFSRPAFGTFGNVGRNSLVGPRDYFANMSVIKDIAFTERFKGQFQFQVFNVFNHAAVELPNSTSARCVDCTVTQGAGIITSLEKNSTMPRLQFAARVTF